MHQRGKTKSSAVLHKGPSLKTAIIDELEPGYPLTIYGYSYVDDVEMANVGVPARGARDEPQVGWMASRLIELDKVQPCPPPVPEFDYVPWLCAGGVAGVGALVILYFYL